MSIDTQKCHACGDSIAGQRYGGHLDARPAIQCGTCGALNERPRPVPIAAFFDAMREALDEGNIERARIQLNYHERELEPLVIEGRRWLIENDA